MNKKKMTKERERAREKQMYITYSDRAPDSVWIIRSIYMISINRLPNQPKKMTTNANKRKKIIAQNYRKVCYLFLSLDSDCFSCCFHQIPFEKKREKAIHSIDLDEFENKKNTSKFNNSKKNERIFHLSHDRNGIESKRLLQLIELKNDMY